MAAADAAHPHGIINVGIFGEGTDSPSLSAVAFLEAPQEPHRCRASRRTGRCAPRPARNSAIIVCPILIPPTADPEKWLSTSAAEEGWQELGQILLALRAHDQRIEENLEELLHLVHSQAAAGGANPGCGSQGRRRRRIQATAKSKGPPGAAQEAVEKALAGKTRAQAGIRRLDEHSADAAVSPALPASGVTGVRTRTSALLGNVYNRRSRFGGDDTRYSQGRKNNDGTMWSFAPTR